MANMSHDEAIISRFELLGIGEGSGSGAGEEAAKTASKSSGRC